MSILQRFLCSILVFLCKNFIWISPSLDQWRFTWNYILISSTFWISSFLTAYKCLKVNTFFPVCILNSFLIWNKIWYSFLFHFFWIDSFPPAIIWNCSKLEVTSTKAAILKFLTKHENIALALDLLILILNGLNLI